jgi:glycerol-3-phosphate dehydrogenase
VFFDRRLTNYVDSRCAPSTGGRLFLEPWQNMSVIGTTDTDYYGDLDDVVDTTAEVRYLIQAVGAGIPGDPRGHERSGPGPAYGPRSTTGARPRRAIAGARGGRPRAARRAGLYSMIGGKLASYRMFAEAMTDAICHRWA